MSEFEDNVREYGLEYYNMYYGMYKGIVISNQDPKGLGRLRVQCPQVHGEDIPDSWSPAKGVPTGTNMGLWFLPNEGDLVWVSFENGDPRYPIWEYGHFTELTDVPERARKKYQTYMLQSPAGQRIEFDDENREMILTSFEGTKIVFDKTGRINIENGSENLKDLLKEFLSEVVTLDIITPSGKGTVGPSSVSNLLKLQARLLKLLK